MAKRRSPARIPVVNREGIQIGSLRQRYRTWQLRFRDPNGIFREKTLHGIRDAKVALERAEVLIAQAAATLPGQAPARELEPKPKTLVEAFEFYEENYANEFKKTSLDRMRQGVRPFVAFVGPTRSPYALGKNHLTRWRDKLLLRIKAGEIVSSSANGDLKRVKAYLNFLKDREWADPALVVKAKRFKVHGRAIAAPSPERVQELLLAFDGHWLHDFSLITANTGLRPSEVLHLRVLDVDLEARLVTVQAWGGWTVKDFEERTLAVNAAAFEALLRRIKVVGDSPEALLFPNSEGGVFEYRNFRNNFWQPAGGRSAEVNPYGLRHYFATQAANGRGAGGVGWDPWKLMKYLGHGDLATTLRYYVHRDAIQTGAPPVVAGVE